MNKIYFSIIVILIFLKSFAQTPIIEWQKNYGGANDDIAESIRQTSDGGYIVAGSTKSIGDDVVGFHGSTNYSDGLVLKLNALGVIEWSKAFGGSKDDSVSEIQQTSDGGYIMIVYTWSSDGDVVGNHAINGQDYWLVKLTSSGSIEWQKCLGGLTGEIGHSVQQTSDGGYIVAGSADSFSGDVVGNHGAGGTSDFWVVKVDSTGIIQWQKCLGGIYNDTARNIKQTADGGYICVGEVSSATGDVTTYQGLYDFWIVKLNSVGIIEWQKSIGGTSGDIAFSVVQCLDGGYAIAGSSTYANGDFTGGIGSYDSWVVKLNSLGIIEWKTCTGGYYVDDANCIRQLADGRLLVVGSTYLPYVSGNHGEREFLVTVLSANGVIQSNFALGGSMDDYGRSVDVTSDGGFVVCGRSNSADGNLTSHYGGNTSDFWVVKFPAAALSTTGFTLENFELYPNPVDNKLNINSVSSFISSSLYDSQGRKIRSGMVGNEIDVSDLSSGIYFLEIGNDRNDIIRKKFIKR